MIYLGYKRKAVALGVYQRTAGLGGMGGVKVTAVVIRNPVTYQGHKQITRFPRHLGFSPSGWVFILFKPKAKSM